MIDALDYGFYNDAITDNTQVWNKWILEQDNEVYFPPGQYIFNNKPLPLVKRVTIKGQSFSTTVLIRNYSVSPYDRFIEIVKGLGSKLEDINLYATAYSGGTALYIGANNHIESPDFIYINNVVITSSSGGMWDVGLELDGAKRANQPLSGVRDGLINNVFIFNCLQAHLKLNTVHGYKIHGQLYQGSGIPTTVALSATRTDKNNNIELDLPCLISKLEIENTVDSNIQTPRLINLRTKNTDSINYITSNYNGYFRLKQLLRNHGSINT